MSKVYNIEVNEEQLRILIQATDLLSRIGMGQWQEIIGYLPLDEYGFPYSAIEEINWILSKYTKNNVNGYHSSIGINNTKENIKISHDLYQVLRYRSSWDYAIENSLTNLDGTRNWANMLQVQYDEPMKCSEITPLAKIEQIKEKETID